MAREILNSFLTSNLSWVKDKTGLFDAKEFRITISLSEDDAELEHVQMHIAIEPLPIAPPWVQVQVMQQQQQLRRNEPTIKSIDWVVTRKTFEGQKDPKSNEVILSNENGALLEGLSSNFAVIVDHDGDGGALLMAPEGTVLAGTIMAIVRKVANHIGVPLVEDCPTIEGLVQGAYRAAFITSTSRLVLPIDEILLPNGNSISLASSKDSLVQMLQLEVKKFISQNSTRLL